jgi:tetratricopeptide (TPR) repeat protein
MVVAELGRTAEATAMLEKALAIQVEVFGPEHPELALTLNTLGNVRFAGGDHTGAVHAYERAVALCERAAAHNPAELALWLYNLGNALAVLGREGEARSTLTRALTLAERAQASSRQVLLPMVALARLELDAGDEPAARELSVRALASDAAELSPLELAELRFTAARALWTGDAERRAQALTLAREAQDLLVGSLPVPELLAEVEGWLRLRGASTRQKILR